MDDINALNAFFETATPAEINQLHAQQAPQQPQPEAVQEEAPQQSALDALQQVEKETKAESAPISRPEPVEQQESPQQVRFREMREAKLRAEWEKEEALRRLRAYEEAAKRPQAKEIEEEDWIKPDEVVEGKHLKEYAKRIRAEAQQQSMAQQEAMQRKLLELQLKMEMPDIDKVVSEDNLRKLAQEMPEVARMIDESPDLYTKAKSAYSLIKKFNNVPLNSHPVDDTKQRIAQNLAKPKPVQSVSRQSPLAGASAYDGPLSPEMKDKLYKEMLHAIRNG